MKKNTIKKLISIILVMVLAFSMAACEKKPKRNAGTEEQQALMKLAFEYLGQYYEEYAATFSEEAYLKEFSEPQDICMPEHEETVLFPQTKSKVCFVWMVGNTVMRSVVFVDADQKPSCYTYISEEDALTIAMEQAKQNGTYAGDDREEFMQNLDASFLYQDILNMNRDYIPTDEELLSEWTALDISHLL